MAKNMDDQTKQLLESGPLTPELREWALRQASEQELITGFKEIQEKGGVELGDVITRLKAKQERRGRTHS